MTEAAPRRCKECGPGSKRPAPNPGPRCFSHWKAELKRRKDRKHELAVIKLYDLTEGQYAKLIDLQGGVCAICGRPPGATKLAVDHNHTTGEVRGLLCGRNPWTNCNRGLGQFRDNPEWLRRAASYLEDPPARRYLDT